MQITNGSIAGSKVIFESIIDEVPGGAGLNVTRLDYLTNNTNVDKRYLKAGAPVYYVPSTRVAEVCKSALAIDGGTSTSIFVGKNHHFKVGDFIGDGTTTGLITAIDTTTSTAYDIVTVNTALTYAAGTKYVEGTVTGSSAVLKYTPNGVVKNDIFIGDGNADCSIVRIGTMREDPLTYPLNTLYKIALRGGASGTGTSLITLI
jgi:hypothetical protein